MYCDPKAGGCGKAFCYVCEIDWQKHADDHFNCNKYTKEVKNKEKNAKKLREQLLRYDFYFTRFMNNKKAVEIVDTKLRETIEEKINILHTVKNLPFLEEKFITDAIDTVVKGKRLLENTYIFGYYMKDKKKKSYFEHKQGILQYWTEELHRLLIDDHLNNIIEEDDFEEYVKILKNYKNSVINIMSSIQKYSKSLIDDIENDFISEIDFKVLDDK